MAVTCLDPLQQFFDNDGNPLARGLLYTKDAVTLDDRAVYTDTEGTTPHDNPIELNSDGRPPQPIFYTQGAAYNLLLKQLPEGSTYPENEGDAVTIDTNVSFEVPDPTAAAASDYFDVVFFKGGTPTVGERLYAEAFGHAVDFPANFAGSYGVTAATPPDAPYPVTIKIGGVEVGTATLSILNVWTFATTGGAAIEDSIASDEMEFFGSEDATTVVDVGLTIVGTVRAA